MTIRVINGKVEKKVIYDVNHDLEYVGLSCFSPHMEDLRDAILAWAQAGAGSLGIYFSPSQCVCLEVSRLASQEAGHHKSRPDYRL